MPTAHDLSMLDGDELTARLGDSRRELFNLRFQLATGQLDNPARVGQVRHDVARILTVLRTREILEAEGAYVAPTAAEHEGALAKLAAEDAAVVEKAAARAAAEGQRGRPLQDLDALSVVEITEILHVVAKTVDEEVRAGIHAADHQFVAVALALVDRDAGHIAGDVGEALKALVPDEVLCQHAQRLRNIDQRRVGLGGDRGAVGVNADRAGAGILRYPECRLRRGLRLGPARGLRPALLGTAVGALRRRAIGASLDLRRSDLDWRKL